MVTHDLSWLDKALDQYDDTTVVFSGDPIAASVAVWQQGVTTNFACRWQDLSQVQVNQEHTALACEIRDFYRDKILLDMLSGKTLTEFRRSLYDLLKQNVYKNQHLGMIYRLPYFYAEDQQRARIYNTCDPSVVTSLPDQPHEKTLYPLEKILRSRRGRECFEFWFRDDQRAPILWEVDMHNPLCDLAAGIFDRQSVRFRAFFAVNSRRWEDNWLHYRLLNVQLA